MTMHRYIVPGVVLIMAGIVATVSRPQAKQPTARSLPHEFTDEVVEVDLDLALEGPDGLAYQFRLSDLQMAPPMCGATPGGFQDLNQARAYMDWGMLPFPDTLTAEGLFSGHDLPVPKVDARGQLLVVGGAAKGSAILNRPEVTHLAQIGFSSGLDARTWKRNPLHLVAVVDVSGSMVDKLPMVKETLAAIAGRLGPDDAFTVIRFADTAVVHLATLRAGPENETAIDRSIEALAVSGGTNIESGLSLGFAQADRPIAGFQGRRRALLITDAMPTVGAATPGTFMAMAEAASLQGVGLTTIGVGLDFDAGLVKRVSAVSGGNAFFFADAAQMKAKIDRDFDFMVTELAFDLQLKISPASGARLVHVYGLPGDAWSRTPDGGMVLDVPTLFLSRERGAIFASFAAEGNSGRPIDGLGRVELSYLDYGATAPVSSAFDLRVLADEQSGLGLARGELLVNEYEGLMAASRALYHDGNLSVTRHHLEAVRDLFRDDSDPTLAAERELIEKAYEFLVLAEGTPRLETLSIRASHANATMCGIWRIESSPDDPPLPGRYLVLRPDGCAALIASPLDRRPRVLRWDGITLVDGFLPVGTLAVNRDGLEVLPLPRSSRNAPWALVRSDPSAVWRDE